jgi:hypothetical protein
LFTINLCNYDNNSQRQTISKKNFELSDKERERKHEKKGNKEKKKQIEQKNNEK